MNKTLPILLVLTSALLITACTKVAFTGRSQAKLLPTSTMTSMSATAYDDFLSQNPPVTSGSDYEMVKRVGNRIQKAAENYYREEGMEAELANYAWEFNLVDSPEPNAWCMEGGKVVIYTGILPITKTEDGLAVVMGHEIAHALAHHGNERMSHQLAVQAGGIALDAALAEKPEMTRGLLMQAYGVGAQFGGILPFSRKHESEADEIGLYLMAMAGYDPNAAAPFWDRMNSMAGQTPPEFMSTHPSPQNRASHLKHLVPKAEEYARLYPIN